MSLFVHSHTTLKPSSIFALKGLLSALAPIIGAEMEKQTAFSADWLKDGQEKLAKWTETGLQIQEEMQQNTMQIFKEEYNRLMRKVRSHFGAL